VWKNVPSHKKVLARGPRGLEKPEGKLIWGPEGGRIPQGKRGEERGKLSVERTPLGGRLQMVKTRKLVKGGTKRTSGVREKADRDTEEGKQV